MQGKLKNKITASNYLKGLRLFVEKKFGTGLTSKIVKREFKVSESKDEGVVEKIRYLNVMRFTQIFPYKEENFPYLDIFIVPELPGKVCMEIFDGEIFRQSFEVGMSYIQIESFFASLILGVENNGDGTLTLPKKEVNIH